MARKCSGTLIAFGGVELADREIGFFCETHNWKPELSDTAVIDTVDELASYTFTMRFRIGTFKDAVDEMNETLLVANIEQTTDERFPYSTNVSVYDKHIEIISFLSEMQFEELFQQTKAFLSATGPKFYWAAIDSQVACAKSSLAMDDRMANLFFKEELSGLLEQRPRLSFVVGSESLDDLRR